MTRIASLLMIAAALGSAQPKPAITPADYGKWETMGQTPLSPDGKWLAAVIRRTNGTSELLRNITPHLFRRSPGFRLFSRKIHTTPVKSTVSRGWPELNGAKGSGESAPASSASATILPAMT